MSVIWAAVHFDLHMSPMTCFDKPIVGPDERMEHEQETEDHPEELWSKTKY